MQIKQKFIITSFQVFGLGNKTYEHYNSVATYVDKRLAELGATRVHELGLGDDDAKYVFKIIREIC